MAGDKEMTGVGGGEKRFKKENDDQNRKKVKSKC